jgi:DNA-binding response OmpR family regulator
VDTHIANLRKKIENDAENPKFIIGVRSIGYKFKTDQT